MPPTHAKADLAQWEKPESFISKVVKNTAANAFGLVGGLAVAPSVYNYVANVDTTLSAAQMIRAIPLLPTIGIMLAWFVLIFSAAKKDNVAAMMLFTGVIGGNLIGYTIIDKHKACVQQAIHTDTAKCDHFKQKFRVLLPH